MLPIESVKLLCNEREYLKINKVIKSNANTFEYINLKFGNRVLIFSFVNYSVYAREMGERKLLINATVNHS